MAFSRYIALIFLLTISGSLFGADFNQVFVFGDSLSDSGNLGTIAPEYFNPGGPYHGLRLTNDKVAVEVMAEGLGLPLLPSNHLLAILTGNYSMISGNNWAVSGARVSGTDEQSTLISLETQVDTFIAVNGGRVPSEALYVLTIGGNDIREARDAGSLRAGNLIVKQAIASLKIQLEKLIQSGAQSIIITDVPDIGAIPETKAIAAAYENKILPMLTTGFSVGFNLRLRNMLRRLNKNYPDVEFKKYSLFRAFLDVKKHFEEMGLIDIDTNCWNGGFYPWATMGYSEGCSPENINSFLFFDEVHPTQPVHEIMGNEMLQKARSIN